MRLFAITVLFIMFSNTAIARQYIQCSDSHSWERLVVNLDGDKSTLFQTNGVHLPGEVRVLKKLKLDSIDQNQSLHIYKTISTDGVFETIVIPSEFINIRTNFMEITLVRDNGNYKQEKEFICYSAIYQD